MNIYTLALIVWLFFAWIIKESTISGSNTRKKDKIILISFVLVFGPIMAFRSINVGTDTWLYSNIFLESGQAENLVKYYMFPKAPVYVLICKMLYIFSRSANTMMIFSAYVTLGVVAYAIYKKSPDVIMSLYLYVVLDYYLYAFNASRQLLAMSFLLISYLKYDEGKKRTGFIWWIIAFGTHNLSILFLVVIILFHINVNKKRFLMITIASLGIECLAMWMLSIFQRIFSQYSDLGTMGYDLRSGDSGGGRVVYALIVILLEILAFYLSQRTKGWIYDQEVIRLLCIINIGLISMIIYRHYYIFVRMEKIFCQFLIILIPMLVMHIFRKKSGYIAKVVLCVAFFIPFLSQTAKYLPYNVWGVN